MIKLKDILLEATFKKGDCTEIMGNRGARKPRGQPTKVVFITTEDNIGYSLWLKKYSDKYTDKDIERIVKKQLGKKIKEIKLDGTKLKYAKNKNISAIEEE